MDYIGTKNQLSSSKIERVMNFLLFFFFFQRLAKSRKMVVLVRKSLYTLLLLPKINPEIFRFLVPKELELLRKKLRGQSLQL